MTADLARTRLQALDDRLCLALYTASRAMTARYRDLLEPLGLTYPQYLVMSALWEEAPLSVTAIGTRLQLDSSTLSPLLKRLETLRLVRRRRSLVDERSVDVGLTAKGRALSRRAIEVDQAICAASGLTKTDRDDLVDRLHRLGEDLSHPRTGTDHG